MRTLATGLAATALAATTLVGAAAPASAAEDKAAHGTVLGYVTANGDSATITGRYRCFGGMQAHLWASIKQGPRINGTTQTSSQYADSWYDTNYNFSEDNPDGLTVPCDGAWHTQSFTLMRVDKTWGPWFPGTALKAGAAYVQFCLVPNPDDEASGSSFGEFKNVKTA